MQNSQTQKPFQFSLDSMIPNIRLPERGAFFLGLIVGATVLFEVFNYSTTEHALRDVMGGLRFLAIPWATILALAFCGIDFAGIARLFSPEEREGKGRVEGMYLLAAWLLAGVINAVMTWWAVTVALLGQPNLGNELVSRQDLVLYVPILVAGAVWLIRILLIGMLTMSGGKIARPGKSPAVRQPIPVQSVPVHQVPSSSMVRPFTGGRS
ncbi:MAG: hypothetical protein ABSC61_04400 [Anaerolineales bacterium]